MGITSEDPKVGDLVFVITAYPENCYGLIVGFRRDETKIEDAVMVDEDWYVLTGDGLLTIGRYDFCML